MKLGTIVGITAMLLIFIPRPLIQAQWVQTNGPSGGPVACIAASGTNLLAATYGNGLFHSTNGGTEWIQAISGPSYVDWRCFATLGSDIYAGGFGGVFRSTDGGATWTEADSGIAQNDLYYPGKAVFSLAVTGKKLLAGTDGDGIFASSDSGRSWSASSTGLTNMGVLSLAVRGASVFAGTFHSVFRSTDSGRSWMPATSGEINENVLSLATSGMNLIAGTTGIYGGSAFNSTDDGVSWSPPNADLPKSCGAVWSLAASGNKVFAGTYSGVFVANGDGSGWTEANADLRVMDVRALAVIDSTLYAATSGGGVWRRSISEMITGVPPLAGGVPRLFRLDQNYPNPFNPSTTIRYSLPERGHVTLAVFNSLGQQVASLVNETQEAGSHVARFEGTGLATGVYFYRLRAGEYVETKKLVILR